jgi:hypothetical protein
MNNPSPALMTAFVTRIYGGVLEALRESDGAAPQVFYQLGRNMGEWAVRDGIDLTTVQQHLDSLPVTEGMASDIKTLFTVGMVDAMTGQPVRTI